MVIFLDRQPVHQTFYPLKKWNWFLLHILETFGNEEGAIQGDRSGQATTLAKMYFIQEMDKNKISKTFMIFFSAIYVPEINQLYILFCWRCIYFLNSRFPIIFNLDIVLWFHIQKYVLILKFTHQLPLPLRLCINDRSSINIVTGSVSAVGFPQIIAGNVGVVELLVIIFKFVGFIGIRVLTCGDNWVKVVQEINQL